MSEKMVYLVLPTLGIGGAEKRFIEIWISLQERGFSNIKLVITDFSYKELLKVSEYSSLLSFKSSIIFFDLKGRSFFKDQQSLKKIYEKYNVPNAIFHFVLVYPILTLNKKNVIYTFPATSLSQFNLKGKILLLFSFFFASKIDVLDPSLFKKFKKNLFWKKNKIFNTPGSFVDTNYFKIKDNKVKKNWLCFLGRFEDVKQVDKLIEAIPKIDSLLKANGIVNHKFFILGNGFLNNKILKHVKSDMRFKEIKMYIGFVSNPKRILIKSKIFFSLQKYSNYPSKSLLEAMSCQNLPIVTDNGDTRLIAKDEFSYFVPENFSSKNLATNCLKILTLPDASFNSLSKQARKHVVHNFSIAKSIEYFIDLYKMKD